jgi:hypothetical protein
LLVVVLVLIVIYALFGLAGERAYASGRQKKPWPTAPARMLRTRDQVLGRMSQSSGGHPTVTSEGLGG